MTVVELKNYIYENEKIEYVLSEIGCGHIVFHKDKNYYSCSNKNGDNRSAINIRNDKYLSCKNYTREDYFGDKADLLTLVQYNQSLDNKNFSFFDTIKYLHKILGLKFTIKKQEEKKDKKEKDPLSIFKRAVASRYRQDVSEIKSISENELTDFVPYVYIDFFKEGIIGKTIKKFGLAYSYRRKRTVIPLRYWATGELLGFNMRTSVDNYDLFGIPKYWLTPNYPKQMNLFGLWENRNDIQKAGYVVVYEAEKSVLKRDSLNDPTGVALSGHEISDEQARILIGLNVEIVIALDKDIPIEHIRHCCEKFYGIRKISYIYDKYDLLKSKDSPADASNKVFNYLFKYKKDYDSKEHNEYIKERKRK